MFYESIEFLSESWKLRKATEQGNKNSL